VASSLVKFYSSKSKSGGDKVYMGRVAVDGVPFRGTSPPFMTEDEFEQRTVKVSDFRNAFFDVNEEADNRAYREVWECCLNGWFKPLCLIRFWQGTTKHYMEWVEFYLEDGSRAPYMTPGMMEVASGQPGILGGNP
jgi:hypothetical protein